MHNCNLTGEINLSGMYGIGSNISQGMYFTAYGNPNLTSIKFPNSPYSISNINCASCNLTGVLDISGLTGLAVSNGNFTANYNRNLTNVVFPDCSGAFYQISLNDCSLSGVLDLSSLRRLGYATSSGVTINVNANRGLTSILFPNASTGAIGTLDASGCNLTGRLDITTPIYYNSNRINLMDNPNLQDVSMVSNVTNVNTYEFNARGCNLSKEGIDRILSFFASSTNGLGMRIYLDGGTSAEPSGAYNNVFLNQLKATKGSNMRYYINYDKEPLLKFPMYYSSGVSLTINSVDGSAFEIDTADGLGLKRISGSLSVGCNYDTFLHYFKIYDGSTYGKDDLKQLIMSQFNILGLDVSSCNSLETLTVTNSAPVLDNVVLPNPSSLTSLSLGTRDISVLDLRNYNNLGVLNITGGVKQILFGDSSVSLSFTLSNCSRITEIDISSLIGISYLTISSCSSLSTIKFPNQFYRTLSNFIVVDTSVQTIDVSNLTLSQSLQITYNPNLTNVVCPSTSVNTVQFFNNNLQGTLDLTSLSTGSTELQAYNNRSLTSILMPKGSLYGILAYDCSLNGVLDISSNTPFFSNPSGVNINLTNNTSLTSVLFPAFSNYPRRILLQNCALDIATMDTLLKRLSTYFSSNSVTQDLSIYLNGGTNSSPTDGEYNMDLSILKWKFQTASKVLDYKIN